MQVHSQQEVQTNFNQEFLARIMPRLEWLTILEGAKSVSNNSFTTCRLANFNIILF